MALSKSMLREKAFERALADAKSGRPKFMWEDFVKFMYGNDEWYCYCETYDNQFAMKKNWKMQQAERDEKNAAEAMKHYGL